MKKIKIGEGNMKVVIETEESLSFEISGETVKFKVLVFGSSRAVEDLNEKKGLEIKKVNAHTVSVGGQKISLNSLEKIKGKDYFVYKNLHTKKHKISLSKDDAEENEKLELIGGFHYGLYDENFKGNEDIPKKYAKKIRGINAYSIWTQKHKPKCDAQGMVFIPKLKIWVDIYLTNSNYKENGTSVSEGKILAGWEAEGRETDGRKELFLKDFVEIGESFNKRLLTKKEFEVCMKGVSEGRSAGNIDDGTIQHIEFLMSRYGIEQAVGNQWVWSLDKYENRDDRQVVLGGNRGYAGNAGSRCSRWNYSLSYSSWNIGSRFACDHLILD